MKYRLKIVVIWTILVVLVLLIFAWVAASFLVVSKPLEEANLIYVLAGSADHAERADEAARIFKQHPASKIILTDDRVQGGWNNELKRNPFFIEKTRWLLLDKGVPDQSIEILPDEVNGTEDEARALVKLACGSPNSKILLVTSAYHTRRTLAIFESVFTICDQKIELGITHPDTGLAAHSKFLWWTKLSLLKNVAEEYAKLIAFYL